VPKESTTTSKTATTTSCVVDSSGTRARSQLGEGFWEEREQPFVNHSPHALRRRGPRSRLSIQYHHATRSLPPSFSRGRTPYPSTVTPRFEVFYGRRRHEESQTIAFRVPAGVNSAIRDSQRARSRFKLGHLGRIEHQSYKAPLLRILLPVVLRIHGMSGRVPPPSGTQFRARAGSG
jgi:hypothetical protein